jgi:hypothetical protein
MNVFIEWVKANVFIVVFTVLMIAALVVLPLLASGMNDKVRKEVEARAKKNAELTKLEQVEVAPGQRGVLNEPFIKRVEEVNRVVADDAQAVFSKALQHNRKGRGVVMPKVLPEMPPEQRDVLPQKFYEAMIAAYESLLQEVHAGTPPSPDSLAEELQRVKTQFITQDLRKSTEEQLEPEQQKALREKLANTRLSRYADAAERISFYASLAQLNPPQYQQTNQPTQAEMYNWQWQFWIVQDVLQALHEANKSDQNVARAPVKQVVQLAVVGFPGSAGGSQSGGSAPGMGSPGMGSPGFGGAGLGSPGLGSPGMGSPGFGGAGAGDSAPAAEAGMATPINPKAPAPVDYSASFTGRRTNPLYDVVYVDLELIVETARLPLVLDALANQNFMTVTDLHLSQVDPYAAAQHGYFYGTAPVSNVRVQLETIWLRSWTQQFMPQSVKQALGVPATTSEQPAPMS